MPHIIKTQKLSRENPNNQVTTKEKALGDSREEKLHFNRKKAPAGPGSGSHLLRGVGGEEGEREDKRHNVEASQRLILMIKCKI